jgi:hypothetical protein
MIFLLVLFLIVPASGASREPFSMGHGMATNGAVCQEDGISAQEPFTGACFYRDTFSFGVTVAGVDYYDAMDNMTSNLIGQAALGGFYTPSGMFKGLVLKAAYLHFDAMRVYYEQEGVLSAGWRQVPFVKPSLEFSAFRAGLTRSGGPPPQMRLEIGASVLVPFRAASVSLAVSHIPLKTALSEGYDNPLTLKIGLHSGKNSLGGQGILMEMEHDDVWLFRVSVGEEYWLSRNFAASLALTTNPVMVSFGVTYAWGPSTSVSAAFNDHPVLGWSKGMALSWAGK